MMQSRFSCQEPCYHTPCPLLAHSLSLRLFDRLNHSYQWHSLIRSKAPSCYSGGQIRFGLAVTEEITGGSSSTTITVASQLSEASLSTVTVRVTSVSPKSHGPGGSCSRVIWMRLRRDNLRLRRSEIISTFTTIFLNFSDFCATLMAPLSSARMGSPWLIQIRSNML